MKELIGFNMVAFGISLIVIWLLGMDDDPKELLIMSIGEPVIMAILSVGAYLLLNK